MGEQSFSQLLKNDSFRANFETSGTSSTPVESLITSVFGCNAFNMRVPVVPEFSFQ
ncbi:hypothetical protein WN51_02334 [Melipona quadrifasciata]|uniref:Uncharacterized protein n=1 Tax=Melipona quadrifasciata TaxID=166423 RepID=A0A0N0BEK8_9HYME|nr:hypothetical protein WN51_02334 [Melipona quadrifasciata]